MTLYFHFGDIDSDFFLSIETEVWELESGNNKIIKPTLGGRVSVHSGIGLYAVDFNFCRTQDDIKGLEDVQSNCAYFSCAFVFKMTILFVVHLSL